MESILRGFPGIREGIRPRRVHRHHRQAAFVGLAGRGRIVENATAFSHIEPGVGVIGIEEVGVLRPSGPDATEIVGEQPLQAREGFGPGAGERAEVGDVEHHGKGLDHAHQDRGDETAGQRAEAAEHDDDEQAILRLKDKRTKLLKGFDADKPVYTRNWDDLDDLEGLSSAWTIALSF